MERFSAAIVSCQWLERVLLRISRATGAGNGRTNLRLVFDSLGQVSGGTTGELGGREARQLRLL